MGDDCFVDPFDIVIDYLCQVVYMHTSLCVSMLCLLYLSRRSVEILFYVIFLLWKCIEVTILLNGLVRTIYIVLPVSSLLNVGKIPTITTYGPKDLIILH